MTPGPKGDPSLERSVAALLQYGTWIASTVVAAGTLIGSLGPFSGPFFSGFNSSTIVTSGIGLFILLPVARVALMLAVFLRQSDYRYAMISTLVLTIIVIGILTGA